MTASEVEAHRVASEVFLMSKDVEYVVNMAKSTGELHIWLGVFREKKHICKRLRRECGH